MAVQNQTTWASLSTPSPAPLVSGTNTEELEAIQPPSPSDIQQECNNSDLLDYIPEAELKVQQEQFGRFVEQLRAENEMLKEQVCKQVKKSPL